jgi:hypothetical protein
MPNYIRRSYGYHEPEYNIYYQRKSHHEYNYHESYQSERDHDKAEQVQELTQPARLLFGPG